MHPSHKKILNILKNTTATSKEIAELTGINRNGVRGRLSELKNKHYYNIQKNNNKFTLHNIKETQNYHNTIHYLTEKQLFGEPIHINQIAKQLNITKEDMETTISKLFQRQHVTQLSKNIIIVYQKKVTSSTH